ncbi:MAG TPA: methylenetetrahydrofolate reductase [Actinomycetota bacterium]|nr:methylenetetrahydrofolate reductase [Actinomycetota bacterium]
MIRKGGRLAALLDAGAFVVTSEVVPPRGGDPGRVRAAARGLVGYVDALNITDSPRASAHMAALAGARFVHEAGAEPTLQLVSRDRNRLAITADILGGWALGARNLLVLGGDPMHVGDHPDATPVFDLTSNEIVALVRRIRDEGTTGAGAEIADPPGYLIGVADVPLADPYDPTKLEAKLDAGADVIWTQISYDTDRLGTWADLVRARGIFERAKVIVGLVPIRSLGNARFLDGLFGVHVPSGAFELLTDAGEDAERAGVAYTIDVVRRLRGIDGISGVHLMGIGRDDLVREVVERSELFPRPTGAPGRSVAQEPTSSRSSSGTHVRDDGPT